LYRRSFSPTIFILIGLLKKSKIKQISGQLPLGKVMLHYSCKLRAIIRARGRLIRLVTFISEVGSFGEDRYPGQITPILQQALSLNMIKLGKRYYCKGIILILNLILGIP
jgi:hypothetical protein